MGIATSPFKSTLKAGEVVVGRVIAINREGAWIDIGSKSEGIIPPSEMTSCLKKPLEIGEEVVVLILQSPNADGQAILSLDKARRFATWFRLERHLSSGEPIEALVISSNKGGLLVKYEGVQGFIPRSHIENKKINSLVGQKIKLKVIEVDQRQGRLILSHKAVVEEEKKRRLSQLVEGEIVKGKVTGIFNFGFFVDIGGIEGLVPNSEVCWETDKKAEDIVKVGQEVEVYILRVDVEGMRLILSLKRTTPHPWERVGEKYQVGQKVMGKVERLFPFGVLVQLDSFFRGLAHISELSPRRIHHPKEVVKEGQILPFKILSIDPDKRQIRLSLRQAQEEG